jgi:hypothetical protein
MKVIPKLRELASDPLWRVREGVATALQRIGVYDKDPRVSRINLSEFGNRHLGIREVKVDRVLLVGRAVPIVLSALQMPTRLQNRSS